MTDYKEEIFIQLYSEHSAWSRHQESQRANISNLILTMTAMGIALIGYDDVIEKSDLPFSVFILLLGFFGLVFIHKYYVQFKYHDSRVEAYKSMLNESLESTDILKIEKESDRKAKENHKLFTKIRVNYIWIAIHSLISLAGLILTILALS
ncbi:MAG: Unknown protein [uncultured Thiotrichaceae bacterium]|uniref:Uncharacterized protein n=1 Tax=uncultured Thiotrichaceae bacterium TaxID=298394 RepID=A0A6S6T668_9GAMM|nr:MAG: Unknown protein [uncultured Thiotrichaceae bacterium]